MNIVQSGYINVIKFVKDAQGILVCTLWQFKAPLPRIVNDLDKEVHFIVSYSTSSFTLSSGLLSFAIACRR